MDGAYLSNGKIKDQCHCTKFCSKEDTPCDFPWPAKNYECSFCKREFKSAQALGGHMNVHRRDRARLRLLPSWMAENSYPYSSPSPNPNPKFASSSPSTKYPPPNLFTTIYRSNNSLSSPSVTYLSSPSSASTDEEKKSVVSSSCHKPSGPQDRCFTKEDESHELKEKNGIVNLELKMGFLEGSNEDLDLELRL